MIRIQPEKDLSSILLTIEKPGRYVGGEYGSVTPGIQADLTVGLSYPDLYEIGMSNQAVKVLYGLINSIDGIVCERVFSPAPDFEDILRRRSVPLYTLESGYPLHELDIIAFSVGYELTLTNLFNILDLGGIPCRRDDRNGNDPLVIAGGPALINPVPVGSFIDAVWIGDAEGMLEDVLESLKDAKKQGGSRMDLLAILMEVDCVWTRDKLVQTQRNVWPGFGTESSAFVSPVVPNIRIVQDQAVVEIMRGCPNGCRFCNAGSLYKPFREKDVAVILNEIEILLKSTGYREVTLSSLSSGDYSCIYQLFQEINNLWKNKRVSFSLPSLKVDSFIFDLLKELSAVRKSGLTFAVETPLEEWQKRMNKHVSKDRIISILKEAKENGWRLAKFYFMIGLPLPEDSSEGDAIIEYLSDIHEAVKIDLNVNIGTFVPKPHTPFQWERQLEEERAFNTLITIKKTLRKKYVKVSFQSPFTSILEGIVSRGDDRAGELVYSAFLKGARLDAWDDYLDRDLWRSIIREAPWQVEEETCRARGEDEWLPWDGVDFGISKGFLLKERKKTTQGETTDPCSEECAHNCGVCRAGAEPRKAEYKDSACSVTVQSRIGGTPVSVLFSFFKKGKARFMSHLDMMRTFERSFQRAGISVRFTEGYNPKPKLEFASPLPLGIAADEEIARIDIFPGEGSKPEIIERKFLHNLSIVLPEGLKITRIRIVQQDPQKKKYSLMSLFWGAEYKVYPFQPDWKDLIDEFRRTDNALSQFYMTKKSDNALTLEIKNANSKDVSIKYFLSNVLDQNFAECGTHVVRTRIFSKDNDHRRSYFG